MKPDCKRCQKRGSACWQHVVKDKAAPARRGGYSRGDRIEYNPEKHCGARTRSKGTPCTLSKGWGTDYPGIGNCRKHMGNTGSHRKQAQNVLAIQAQATYGLPREVDPHTALLEEVHRTAGHVAWLALVIQSYDPEALTYGAGGQRLPVGTDKWVPISVRKSAPAVWLQLYDRERRHLTDVCKTAIACGLAERHVKIAEEQGQVIARVMRDFTKALAAEYGFDPEAEPVRKAARRSLTLIPLEGAA